GDDVAVGRARAADRVVAGPTRERHPGGAVGPGGPVGAHPDVVAGDYRPAGAGPGERDAVAAAADDGQAADAEAWRIDKEGQLVVTFDGDDRRGAEAGPRPRGAIEGHRPRDRVQVAGQGDGACEAPEGDAVVAAVGARGDHVGVDVGRA